MQVARISKITEFRRNLLLTAAIATALVVITSAAVLFAPAASADTAADVPYIDELGDTQNCSEATVLDQAYFASPPYLLDDSVSGGWYVVTGTINLTDKITISGNVNIILEDNCDMTVTAGIYDAGISVSGTDSLTIYAQSAGIDTGKLTASGGDDGIDNDGGAGIGGDSSNDGGTITINGGTVTASGGMGAAGIGGGDWGGDGGTITINGGTVTATGVRYGAGIGGGYGGNGGTTTINGGTVIAKGGYEGAGIGGGNGGNGGTTTINGGTVTAIGGSLSAGIGGGGNGGDGGTITIGGGTVTATGGSLSAGIGGGDGGDGGTITINGGTVTATGGEHYGAGIGGGDGGDGGTVTINGGTVTATGGDEGAGIGGGYGGDGGTITISGGTVTATGGEFYGSGIGSGSGGANATVEITGGSISASVSGTPNSYIHGRPTNDGTTLLYLVTVTVDPAMTERSLLLSAPTAYGFVDIMTDITGKIYLWLPAGVSSSISVFAGGKEYTGTVTPLANDSNTMSMTPTGVVAYVDVDGSTGYTSVTPTAITGGETGLTSGWYYADGTTFTYATTINVSGDVHLIIANDCTMNTFYVFGQGGFTVTPGSNLWIYSQPEEAGHDIGRADESAGIAIILQSGSSFTNTAAVTALMQGVFSASAVTVTNGVTGTIEGTEQGVWLDSGGTVVNSGTINGTNWDAIYSGGSISISNDSGGTIQGGQYGIHTLGGGIVTNSGAIVGNDYYGIFAEGTPFSVTNNFGSLIQGGDIGILIDQDGYVNNSGTIEGFTQQGWNGSGIVFVNGNGTVVNSGTITGHLYNGIYAELADVHITNEVGGTIQGPNNGINLGSGGTVINNNVIYGGNYNGIYAYDGQGISPSVTVTNASSGTIEGGNRGIFLDADVAGNIDNEGRITGNIYYGIHAVTSANVENNTGGVITGPGGVYIGNFASGDEIENSGLIQGTMFSGIEINAGSDILITNNAAGIISGERYGIYLNVSGSVHNLGGIAGNLCGICAEASANIENDTGGVITGPSGVYIGAGSTGDEIENSGLIQGTMFSGIEINAGSDILITNNAAGIISGERNGIYLNVSSQVHNEGGIAGNLCGIYAEASANIENDTGGVITGPSGVYIGNFASGDEIENSGLIQGMMFSGIEINAGSDFLITNNAAGIISGERYGVCLNVHGSVYNEGGIAGNLCGVYAVTSAAIDNAAASIITGPTGVYIGVGSTGDEIENSGLIQGTMFSGIEINAGSDFLITNNAAGIISGDRYGIYFFVSGSVYNEGGIAGNLYGIYAEASANIENDTGGVITGPSGVYIGAGSAGDKIENSGLIQGTVWDGIYLVAGGEVYNYGGEIKGNTYGIRANAGTVIENWDLITGDVLLSNDVNRAAFAADSVIDGNFTIGSNANSALDFIGSPNLVTMVYATVNGAADIGAAAVDIDSAGPPAGMLPGGKMILIDGSAGTMSGTPANPTLAVGGYDLRISVVSDQLIAEVFIPVVTMNYVITATSDSMTSISPNGKTAVQKGNDITFVFSANTGFYIDAVIVDGVQLSQTDIRRGSYSFYNVDMNHSIQVTGRTTRVGGDITLNIGAIEGRGYAEYSVDGGVSFTRYTSTVVLSENTDLIIRAVAEGGYEFKEWREGSDVYKTSVVTFYSNAESVDMVLCFSGGDSAGYWIWIAAVIAVALILLISAFLIFGRKNS